jgi:hypothetical protein
MYLITVLKQILDPEGFVHSKQENYWEDGVCPLLVDQGKGFPSGRHGPG